ncbi:eukaryotic translation initiation factor 4 gamma 3-like isoform X1 [Eurosta solidaginis]|uniref:eukaryotic translation initiation factor 4 gamma 3-like isoform X1 n=2 Tax=Eurosta solidaginis TaxID=178769 RepID=UPI0035316885
MQKRVALLESSLQLDSFTEMQPQPTQNMYVQSTLSNTSSQVRSNQVGNLYRAASASPASRNGTRHVPMPAMYPQSMHQGVQSVVMQPFAQYQRQAFQPPPYTQYTQTMPPNYPYPYPSYYPVPAQRGTVSNTMPVQPGPPGTISGPAGAAQAQVPIAPGTVITTGAVPQVSTPTVLGVAPSPNGPQVSVQSMASVVQATVPTQPNQKTTRRRAHALEIIDPSTNKNILDDFDSLKTPQDIEYPEQNVYIQQPIVIAEQLHNLQYDVIEVQPMSRDATLGQTPVVSAITDGPSVEILPSTQKSSRSKKILSIVNPKDGYSIQNTASRPSDNLSSKFVHQPEKVVGESAQAFKPTNVSGTKEVPNSLTSQQTEDGKSVKPDALILAEVNEISKLQNQQAQEKDCLSHETIAAISNTNSIEEKLISELSMHLGSNNMPVISSKVHNVPHSKIVTSELKEYLNKSTGKVDGNQNVSTSDSSTRINSVTKGDTTFLTYADETSSNQYLVCEESKGDKERRNISIDLPISLNGIGYQQVEPCKGQYMKHNIDAVNEYDETVSENQEHMQCSSEINSQSQQTSKTSSSSVCTIISSTTDSRVTPPAEKESKETVDLIGYSETENGTSHIHNKTGITDIVPMKNVFIPPRKGSSVSELQQYLISYNEGQWSPENVTGKKQYDREQLLLLRDSKASRRQPDVNIVSILPTPNLLPSFVRNSKRIQSMVSPLNNKRSAIICASAGDSYGNKQASMSSVHGRGSMRGMIRVNLSLNQDVKLSETENAWRPRVLEKDGCVEGDLEARGKREKEELIRRVRGILNKLTPDKFDTLVEEIIKLKIDTPDKMEEVMVLVFEKAIDEPSFSVSYARLCHRLITEAKARDERMESGTKTNLAQFRATLLDKTEREFTQNVTKNKAKENKLQPIIDKISNCTDLTEKAELEAQLEEEERKIRRRSGGTVRFIGELFKISMLTGKIINSCIDALLNPNSEDQLECLCKLLTTVGAKFEQTPINVKESTRCYSLEKTVARMQAIAAKTDKEGSKVSSRVRFMLQDVIDLRREKWQSKRHEAPKTMGQVEKEMKSEQLFNYAGSGSGSISGGGISNGIREERSGRYNDLRSGYGGSNSQKNDLGTNRRQQVSNSGRHSNINEGPTNPCNDDSTWHVQTGKGNRSLDTMKLEGLTTANNFDIKKMGGVSQFIWSSGSRQTAAPTLTPTNSFAALSALSDTNRMNERDRSGPRNKGSFNKSSTERDRYGLNSRSSSSQTSRENSSSKAPQLSRSVIGASAMQKSANDSKYVPQIPSRKTTKTTECPQHGISTYSSYNSQAGDMGDERPLDPLPAVFEKSSDVDIKVIKALVSDMLEVASNSIEFCAIEPCIMRIKESQHSALLYYIMTEYLHLRHIGQLQRRYLGNIIVYLIQNNFISRDHFKLAYHEFCKIASDLALDIPDLWKYIIEFSGPMVKKNILTVYDLWNNQLKEDNGDNFGKKLLKTFLDYCLTEIGPSFTHTMWKNTNVKWSDFMTETEIKAFIEMNKYEYIEDESMQPKIAVKEPKEDAMSRILDNVHHFLKDRASADQIIDYINGNCTEVDKSFIRNLVTKLCDFAISYKDTSYKLDTDCFQKICIPVLHRYIDSKEEFELECLYSMQLLVARLEHPRGLLSDLFGEIYDADVIPQDSFVKWRDSKDQSAGKGVAVKGLNPFFNHVLNSETSDENN